MKALLNKLLSKGPRGPRGAQGRPGPSAYDIAVQYGFKGTPQEWLRSLKGESGMPGAQGVAGRDGAFKHEYVRHESHSSDDDLLIVASAVALEKHLDNPIIRDRLKALATAVKMVDDSDDLQSGLQHISRARDRNNKAKRMLSPGVNIREGW